MVGSKCCDFKNREVSNVNAPHVFLLGNHQALVFFFYMFMYSSILCYKIFICYCHFFHVFVMFFLEKMLETGASQFTRDNYMKCPPFVSLMYFHWPDISFFSLLCYVWINVMWNKFMIDHTGINMQEEVYSSGGDGPFIEQYRIPPR